LRALGDTPVVEQIALLHEALPGFAARCHRRVLVTVDPAGQGSTLQLRANATDFLRLSPVIQRTLLLASSIEGGGPGLAEANLAAFRLARLLHAAKATTDTNRRGNLLRRAARHPTAPSSLFSELAQMAANNGQLEEATTYLRRGLLAEPDAHVRGQLAALADDFAQQLNGTADLRAQALGRLVSGDLAGAEKLLHSARRNDAKPALDYQLLAHVHRHRGDEMAALAAQLLAREYDASTHGTEDAEAIARNRGISNLAQRLSLGAHAVRASSKLNGRASTPATPPR